MTGHPLGQIIGDSLRSHLVQTRLFFDTRLSELFPPVDTHTMVMMFSLLAVTRPILQTALPLEFERPLVLISLHLLVQVDTGVDGENGVFVVAEEEQFLLRGGLFGGVGVASEGEEERVLVIGVVVAHGEVWGVGAVSQLSLLFRATQSEYIQHFPDAAFVLEFVLFELFAFFGHDALLVRLVQESGRERVVESRRHVHIDNYSL